MVWLNALLAVSNLAAVPAIAETARSRSGRGSTQKLLALCLLVSMLASMSFHALERNMHGLPGIGSPTVLPVREETLLLWDRLAALSVAISMLAATGGDIWGMISMEAAWLALFVNGVGEIVPWFAQSPAGVVLLDTAILGEWNRTQWIMENTETVYGIFHSLWHVLVYYAVWDRMRRLNDDNNIKIS